MKFDEKVILNVLSTNPTLIEYIGLKVKRWAGVKKNVYNSIYI